MVPYDEIEKPDGSFGSLASKGFPVDHKGFPSGYSKSVCACVRMPSENSEPTRWFSQTTPDEHPPGATAFFFPFFFFFFSSHFTFQLLDKLWSQVSSLLPPGTCLQFYRA